MGKKEVDTKTYNFPPDILKKCSPELNFKFYGNNGRIIAQVSNLEELITTLAEIPASIAHFHIYRETDMDLFDDRRLDGPVIRSDIALWIDFVLGDKELSQKIYNAGKEEPDSEKLKKRVLDILKQREHELLEMFKNKSHKGKIKTS